MGLLSKIGQGFKAAGEFLGIGGDDEEVIDVIEKEEEENDVVETAIPDVFGIGTGDVIDNTFGTGFDNVQFGSGDIDYPTLISPNVLGADLTPTIRNEGLDLFREKLDSSIVYDPQTFAERYKDYILNTAEIADSVSNSGETFNLKDDEEAPSTSIVEKNIGGVVFKFEVPNKIERTLTDEFISNKVDTVVPKITDAGVLEDLNVLNSDRERLSYLDRRLSQSDPESGLGGRENGGNPRESALSRALYYRAKNDGYEGGPEDFSKLPNQENWRDTGEGSAESEVPAAVPEKTEIEKVDEVVPIPESEKADVIKVKVQQQEDIEKQKTIDAATDGDGVPAIDPEEVAGSEINTLSGSINDDPNIDDAQKEVAQQQLSDVSIQLTGFDHTQLDFGDTSGSSGTGTFFDEAIKAKREEVAGEGDPDDTINDQIDIESIDYKDSDYIEEIAREKYDALVAGQNANGTGVGPGTVAPLSGDTVNQELFDIAYQDAEKEYKQSVKKIEKGFGEDFDETLIENINEKSAVLFSMKDPSAWLKDIESDSLRQEELIAERGRRIELGAGGGVQFFQNKQGEDGEDFDPETHYMFDVQQNENGRPSLHYINKQTYEILKSANDVLSTTDKINHQGVMQRYNHQEFEAALSGFGSQLVPAFDTIKGEIDNLQIQLASGEINEVEFGILADQEERRFNKLYVDIFKQNPFFKDYITGDMSFEETENAIKGYENYYKTTFEVSQTHNKEAENRRRLQYQDIFGDEFGKKVYDGRFETEKSHREYLIENGDEFLADNMPLTAAKLKDKTYDPYSAEFLSKANSVYYSINDILGEQRQQMTELYELVDEAGVSGARRGPLKEALGVLEAGVNKMDNKLISFSDRYVSNFMEFKDHKSALNASYAQLALQQDFITEEEYEKFVTDTSASSLPRAVRKDVDKYFYEDIPSELTVKYAEGDEKINLFGTILGNREADGVGFSPKAINGLMTEAYYSVYRHSNGGSRFFNPLKITKTATNFFGDIFNEAPFLLSHINDPTVNRVFNGTANDVFSKMGYSNLSNLTVGTDSALKKTGKSAATFGTEYGEFALEAALALATYKYSPGVVKSINNINKVKQARTLVSTTIQGNKYLNNTYRFVKSPATFIEETLASRSVGLEAGKGPLDAATIQKIRNSYKQGTYAQNIQDIAQEVLIIDPMITGYIDSKLVDKQENGAYILDFSLSLAGSLLSNYLKNKQRASEFKQIFDNQILVRKDESTGEVINKVVVSDNEAEQLLAKGRESEGQTIDVGMNINGLDYADDDRNILGYYQKIFGRTPSFEEMKSVRSVFSLAIDALQNDQTGKLGGALMQKMQQADLADFLKGKLGVGGNREERLISAAEGVRTASRQGIELQEGEVKMVAALLSEISSTSSSNLMKTDGLSNFVAMNRLNHQSQVIPFLGTVGAKKVKDVVNVGEETVEATTSKGGTVFDDLNIDTTKPMTETQYDQAKQVFAANGVDISSDFVKIDNTYMTEDVAKSKYLAGELTDDTVQALKETNPAVIGGIGAEGRNAYEGIIDDLTLGMCDFTLDGIDIDV